MEDGDENLGICEADDNPERQETGEKQALVYNAEINSKMIPNSGPPSGDSNGSSGVESEPDEDGISREFHIPMQKSKMIVGLNTVNSTAIDLEDYPAKGVEDDESISDTSSEEEECVEALKVGCDDSLVPTATLEDPIIPSDLTVDSTNSLVCLSDIASTLRPNSLPRDDGVDPERMEVDFQESESRASSESALEPVSAYYPVRTEVTSDKSESERDADESIVERIDTSLHNEPCQNGESISSDLMLGCCEPVLNFSRTSSSPINRFSDTEKESPINSISKEICDNEQAYEVKIEGVSLPVCETEAEDLSSDPNSLNVSHDDVRPSSVCGAASQVETESSEVLEARKSMSFSSQENQCNGDTDCHEDTSEDGIGWCDTDIISGETENMREGSCEKKRKQTFDEEVDLNFLTGEKQVSGSTKMFKVNHNDAQLNQQSTVDKECTIRTPYVSQPLGGRSFFPGNFQANSQITEYAQYLGLQPTVKFKCVRCGEKSFSSMMDLKTHQYACLKSHATVQVNPSPASLPSHQTSSTNFRITRKVYLCSVCGTYYENWNLFLHMREVHKRHICLFCLGMFSQAERLSAHLVAKHNIVEGHYGNVEEFRLTCKGSVFLMCCSCEKVFSEEESFSNHPCKDRSFASKSKPSSNALVPGKSQTSHVFSKSLSEKSKQSADGGSTRPVKQSEAKSGKGSAASGRPKQILKVKIPMQPKTQESLLPSKTFKPPPVIQGTPPTANANEKNGLDSTQLADASLFKPKAALASQPSSDSNFLSNLDKTINSVALGLSSEALEWQQKKSEDIRDLEEPARPCVGGAIKSHLHSGANTQSDGNVESMPIIEPLAQQIPEMPPEAPEISKIPPEVPEISEYFSEAPEIPPEAPEISPEAPEISPEAPEISPEAPEISPEVPEIPLEAPEIPPEAPGIPAEETHKQPSPMHIPEIVPPSPEAAEPSEPVLEAPSSVPPDALMDMAPSPAAPDSPPAASESPPAASESPPEPEVTEQTPAEDSDVDTDDSDKLSLVVDETASGAENEVKGVTAEKQESVESEPEPESEAESEPEQEPEQGNVGEGVEDPVLVKGPDIALAGEDVPITEVTLEESLEAIPIQALLKECVKALCYVCVYCSHARRIAVNGKQLALHTLAEHRFSPVDGSDCQDPPPCARFTSRLKDSVQILQDMFFNTDTYDSTDKTACLPYDRSYECFHCHFFTRSHKELYIHNRKMHQKTILLCIMCKSNFYSYSELLCHLCPGIYIPQCNISFRCCMCDVDNLPSAFRLMVHLRKRHHACDVCLEITDDQQKLSSHVWKHKLHHLCYRCGIAYRNKPDITNHLFWKHGTESVLCKKCLQKKWPHVYHFCVPPATFTCEECNCLLSRAVSLRVHKRIHTGEQPHPCLECEEKFISKKLLAKHTKVHRTPEPEQNFPVNEALNDKAVEEISTEDLSNVTGSADDHKDSKEDVSDSSIKKEEEKKKLVDVYDLPPLNLSSESDSSDDEAKTPQPVATFTEAIPLVPQPIEEPQVVDGIWDKFQNYKANLEKMETAETAAVTPTPEPQEDPFKIVMMDHDYCAPVDPNKPPEPEPVTEVKDEEPATETEKEEPDKTMQEENPSLTPSHNKEDVKSTLSESPSKKKRSPKKKTHRRSSSSSSNSSSGSDSSSCSCGTNCSCSSSSSSDSSSSSSDSDSSSSEGKRRALVRRELRRERALEKKKEEETVAAAQVLPPEEPHIDVMEAEPAFRESDLDTTETETDEDFYDERPQKLLEESQAEKRNLVLAPLNNGAASPAPVQPNPAALVGSKKRAKKRKKKQSKLSHHSQMPPPSLSMDPQPVDTYYPYSAPSPIAVPRHAVTPSFQQSTPEYNSKRPLVTKLTREVIPGQGSGSETEGRTKRKRMPNKFYGYSSDEDAEESWTHKWRKSETTIAHTPTPTPTPTPPLVATIPRPPPVTPLTLKRTVPSVQEAPPPITLQLSRSLIAKAESERVTSSSSSSDSDDDAMQISEGPPIGHASTTVAGNAPVRETNDNLYCYCQCPYDEVSEMIACDGKNCAIEWFHFECVGIMVPPKGQWYCPDCRKNMTGYQGE